MVGRNIKSVRSSAAVTSVPIQSLLVRLLPVFFIVLALLGIFLHKIHASSVQTARIFLTDLITPIFSGISTPVKNAVTQVEAVTGIRDLRAENIRLIEENRRLQQWYDIALKLEAENRGLKSLLNFKAMEDYKYISTRIVADPGGNFIKSMLIPVGKLDGVKKGQAVLAENSVIGRVIEVGKNASRVLMITDLNSRIPVMIEGTRQRAILVGDNGDTMFLKHLALDSKPQLNSRVVTSGDGGIMPPNLPIGKIISNADGRVQVKSLDNLKQLEYVRVVDFFINDALTHGNIE